MHGGNVWQAEQFFGIPVHKLMDFSANINPLGPSPRAIEAVQRALEYIKFYPEPQAETLLKELAKQWSLPQDRLILGNGAAELIYALGRLLTPKRVLLPVPTFSEYAASFAASEQVPILLDRNEDFSLKPEQLYSLLEPEDLLIICNPNNPTGQLVSKDMLLVLVNQAKAKGAWVMLDEAFMDFVYPQQSLLRELSAYPNLIIVRSLTKIYALPGLRLGYLAAAPRIIDELYKNLPPWRVNVLAQVAGLASLQDQIYLSQTLALVNQQRQYLIDGFNAIPGLKALPAAANFILVDCRQAGCTAAAIRDYLAPRGILVRLCDNFQGLDKYFFRVAVRNQEQNHILLTELQQFIASHGK